MSTGYGMAAQIVGTELQGWAALLDKWAMGDVYNQERATQKGFTDQAGALFNQRLQGAGADAAGQQMKEGAQSRQAAYQSVNATPLSISAAPLNSLQNARNSAYSSLLGQQRAKLGSYGDWLQNQWLANQQTNRGLGQITNFARGQAGNVFPLQMYAAQHSMDDLAAIGQAISSLGGGGTNFSSLFNSSPGTPNAPNFKYPGVSGGQDLPDISPVNDLGSASSLYALG